MGLYLATLAAGAGNAEAAIAGLDVHGNDRIVADYLHAEVLSSLPRPTARFLVRCSVLDSLSGPLCDAVMGATGSQEVLEALEASNLLVVPLDRQRRWYRCHHLLPRPPPGRAGAIRARAHPAPARPGRGVVRGQRAPGARARARPGRR